MAAPPGLGPFANLALARRLLADPRPPIDEFSQRLGPIWQSLMPSGRARLVPLVWLLGPAGNERILSPKHKEDFSWFEGYRLTMEPLFGRQILLLSDDDDDEGQADEHRQRMRLLTPAFHPRLDDDYLQSMRRIVELHLDALPLDRPVDLQWAVKRLTFHIVAQLLLGADDDDMPALTRHFEELSLGLFTVVHLPIPGLPFYRAKRARAALQRYLAEKLAASRAGQCTPSPMLRSLLSASSDGGLSDDSIIAELISFLYAGYDTTSSMLTSLLVALERNPAVFTRLRDAVQAGAVDDECPYLEAVLLEAERLYPPLLFLLRGVRRDFSFGGYDIKAGSKVAYSPYYTGRMPELFDEPLRFRPERFLDDKGALQRPAPYTVVGFGAGHRMCIGKRLAGLEMRLFLSRFLRRFSVAAQPDQSEAAYCNPAPFRKHGYFAQLQVA